MSGGGYEPDISPRYQLTTIHTQKHSPLKDNINQTHVHLCQLSKTSLLTWCVSTYAYNINKPEHLGSIGLSLIRLTSFFEAREKRQRPASETGV